MEDKRHSNFYEFLLANSELTNNKTAETKPKPQSKYVLLSWLVIFFSNTLVLWLSWNYVVSSEFGLPVLSFIQSAALYAAMKTLFRGFFSTQ